jgi:regulation of enolase protein 1 (concanavalin A-like superfamily)
MDGTAVDFRAGRWLNRPEVLVQDAGALRFRTAEGGDFWRQTHYGFERASGHALLCDMPERFAAEVEFAGRFEAKYEQAGLLLWQSAQRWIKAGIEYADGRPNLAVVVTDGRSDWSMAPADPGVTAWRLRMTATDTAVIVHARGAGGWQILRVSGFVAGAGVRLGPMACSPLSAGLEVTFREMTLGPVPDDPLYLG